MLPRSKPLQWSPPALGQINDYKRNRELLTVFSRSFIISCLSLSPMGGLPSCDRVAWPERVLGGGGGQRVVAGGGESKGTSRKKQGRPGFLFRWWTLDEPSFLFYFHLHQRYISAPFLSSPLCPRRHPLRTSRPVINRNIKRDTKLRMWFWCRLQQGQTLADDAEECFDLLGSKRTCDHPGGTCTPLTGTRVTGCLRVSNQATLSEPYVGSFFRIWLKTRNCWRGRFGLNARSEYSNAKRPPTSTFPGRFRHNLCLARLSHHLPSVSP